MLKNLLLAIFALLALPVFAQKPRYGGRYDKTYQIGDTTVFWTKVRKSAYLKYFKDSTWLFTKRIRSKKNGETEVLTLDMWIGSTRNGPAFIYYSSGEVKVAYQYQNDKVNGQATWYYKSGKTMARTTFKKNKRHGAYLSFFENGNQQCVCWYSEGKRDSMQTRLYSNGQVRGVALFQKGKLMKEQKSYAPDGSPLPSGTLKNGNGTLNEYDDSGRLVKIWTYKNGKKKRKPKVL